MKSDIRINYEGEKKKLLPQSIPKGEILNLEKSERDDSEGENSRDASEGETYLVKPHRDDSEGENFLKMIPKVKYQSREIPPR
jgi:hypothetical protein